MRIARSFFVVLSLIALYGCAKPERLPAYRWIDAPTALRDLAARAEAVKTVSATCDITLSRPDGQSIRLDGALAMRPPNSVRLRAWKLGQAVFDLTLTPDGVWVVVPTDAGQKQRVLPASVNAARMAKAWAIFSGAFFNSPDARVINTDGRRFSVVRLIDQQYIECEIDRATLTPRVYRIFDQPLSKTAPPRFTLVEDQYQMINAIPWPTRLNAKSEGGTIALELHDIELNADLAPNAFAPPRRAEKLP